MDSYYQILDLLYQINKMCPEISFGQLMHNLTLKNEFIFYMSNDEIINRLKEILKGIKGEP